MYVPVVYPVPKTKADLKNFSKCIGLIIIIASLFLAYETFRDYDKNVQMNTSCDVSPQEMIDSGDIYKFEESAVIDYYATTTSDDYPTKYYFIIAYFANDDSDKACLASISLDKNNGEFFKTMRAYSESVEGQYITFFAKAEPMANLDKDINAYYVDYAKECMHYYDNVVDSKLSLNYCFDDEGQFEEYCQNQKEVFISWIEFALVLFAVGLVFIILGFIKRGPSKKQLAAAREMLKAQSEDNSSSDEDDRYNYINSDDYFGRPAEDYNYHNTDE
ncbi:MAG: hypothetical protein K2J55_06030 [Eubacterium sp.]|nr:hypothetical protein [Eubacterium sp.]